MCTHNKDNEWYIDLHNKYTVSQSLPPTWCNDPRMCTHNKDNEWYIYLCNKDTMSQSLPPTWCNDPRMCTHNKDNEWYIYLCNKDTMSQSLPPTWCNDPRMCTHNKDNEWYRGYASVWKLHYCTSQFYIKLNLAYSSLKYFCIRCYCFSTISQIIF